MLVLVATVAALTALTLELPMVLTALMASMAQKSVPMAMMGALTALTLELPMALTALVALMAQKSLLVAAVTALTLKFPMTHKLIMNSFMMAIALALR